jgi:hypothetical protein
MRAALAERLRNANPVSTTATVAADEELLAQIVAEPRSIPSRAVRRRRGRLLVAAVGLAIVGAITALVGVGTHGGENAAAARVLRKIAAVASARPAPKPVTRGQFRYTKSVVGYMSGGKGWNAVSPGVREIWLGPTGGRIHERWGKPTFPTAADRQNWIAAGRPQVNPREDSGNIPPVAPLNLPTDPDALYAELHDRAVGHGSGTRPEMFTLVGDALRESDASPALRASLYEVAARIPGVELVGPATDRIGRHGVAVAYVDGKLHERHELIFDPRTAALLGEEYVELDGNSYGYPSGTVTGYATYVASAIVDRLGARPASLG